MDNEPQNQEQLKVDRPICKEFKDVKSYSDLAEVVFFTDSRSVHSGWNPNEPGDPKNGRYDSKTEWLTSTKKYHLDEWWIYDSEGQGYNLGKIARQMNPDWEEGESWIGALSENERLKIIKESWERAQDERTAELAKELGGKSIKLAHVSMEAGISSAIILSETSPHEQLVFRGVSNQRKESLDRQASGMLRTGMTDKDEPTNGSIYVNRLSQIIDDQEVKDAVYALSDNPTETHFRRVIDLYKQKGLTLLAEEATTSLGWVLDKTARGINFAEALVAVHTDLMQGNIGISPFVATGTDAGACEGFTGANGLILVTGLSEDRVSSLKARGNERLIKGWIDRREIKAIISVNRHQLKQESSYEDIEQVFKESGEEIEKLLQNGI